MQEMMVDIETLDTRVGAVVLSIGAVIWRDEVRADGNLHYIIEDRFMRILDLDSQFAAMRSVSQSTLLWWMQQNAVARAEAFSEEREPVASSLSEFHFWATSRDEAVSRFWASPATFDFPIIETLAEQFGVSVPWTYRQKRDVRTVVDEAKYSAKDHSIPPNLLGADAAEHTPVYDCEWQIDLLTAARNKLVV